MVAGLVKLAHNGKMSAIDEILNQLDGKVAEVYHLLGDDVVTTSYALEAQQVRLWAIMVSTVLRTRLWVRYGYHVYKTRTVRGVR